MRHGKKDSKTERHQENVENNTNDFIDKTNYLLIEAEKVLRPDLQ